MKNTKEMINNELATMASFFEDLLMYLADAAARVKAKSVIAQKNRRGNMALANWLMS